MWGGRKNERGKRGGWGSVQTVRDTMSWVERETTWSLHRNRPLGPWITQALSMIVEADGWAGLFGRGLRTRLLTNALQGAVFSVLWKYFEQTLA